MTPAAVSAAEDSAYEVLAEDEAQPTYAEDLREAATELWHFREMLYQLTLRDVRIRYKQAVIGFGWALLMPALIVLSGCLVRYAMTRKSGAPLDLAGIASISVKALPWSFFVGTISFATSICTTSSR